MSWAKFDTVAKAGRAQTESIFAQETKESHVKNKNLPLISMSPHCVKHQSS